MLWWDAATYPKPWTAEVEQLVAFSFGVIAHAGEDTPWHSLGHNGGLIQSMQYVEFRNSFNDAHSRADTGTCPWSSIASRARS